MPGSTGTGRPLWFRCSRCRLRHGTNEYFGERSTRGRGDRFRVELTGRKRECRAGSMGARNSRDSREYRCLDCHHVGWSRHIDLERKAQYEGETP